MATALDPVLLPTAEVDSFETATVAPVAPLALTPLAGPPVTTIHEVIARQRAIQHHLLRTAPRRGRDGLACFNFLYRIITEDVLAKSEQPGFFQDVEFVLALDVAFANRYFDALRADALGEPVPEAWQALLHARNRRHVSAVRFAVAGVNAHVNYDLPFALLTTVEQLHRPLDYGTQRADYEQINEIFAIHMRGLRQHFQSHLERRLDDLFLGRVANLAGNVAVDFSRDVAWNNAERYWARRTQHAYLSGRNHRLDGIAGLLGRTVLLPLPLPI